PAAPRRRLTDGPDGSRPVSITDRRDKTEVDDTILLIVATDIFLSGWGTTPGRNIYAIPCRSEAEGWIVLANMRDRSDMSRPRIVGGRHYRPRLLRGDHVVIDSPSQCERWYEPDAFRTWE